MPVGTPAYMAPEQVAGTEIDGRADLYALGVMLFEVLTGEKPWRGPTVVAMMMARLLNPPPDPRELDPAIGEAAAELVLRLMSPKAEARPSSAAEVRRALAQVLEDAPGAPRPASAAPAVAATAAAPAAAMEATAEGSSREPSLAVLAFRNAGQAGDEHWADGFTHDLIDTLSLVPRLRVRSRGAVMAFKNREQDPRDIGRELGVMVVVEGSVRRHGHALRIVIRAVSVADGFQLWAQRFERADTDLLSVADEAAAAIAEALLKQLEAPRREPMKDPLALDLYLRARQLHHLFSLDSSRQASELLEQALLHVPDEPRILAACSLARARTWLLAPENEGMAYHRALGSAEQAMRLAPQLGESHLAVAALRLQELLLEEGIDALQAALARSPLLAEAHEHQGRLLLELGAHDEGMAALQRAVALEPGLTAPRRELARALAMRGELERAGRLIDEIEAAGHAGAPALRARMLVWAGQLERAATLMADTTNATMRTIHNAVFGGASCEESLRSPGQGLPPPPRRGRRALFYQQLRCEYLAMGGQRDAALAVLEQADAGGLFDVAWLVECPALDSLRGSPHFAAVHARLAPRAAALLARLRA
jgi:serine/threonine-protein kinase